MEFRTAARSFFLALVGVSLVTTACGWTETANDVRVRPVQTTLMLEATAPVTSPAVSSVLDGGVGSDNEIAEQDRPEGQCSEPVSVTGGSDQAVPAEMASSIVLRFLSDRAAGNRAQQCLTETAEDDFDSPKERDGLDYAKTCLFHCEEGLSPVLNQPVTPLDMGSSGSVRWMSAVINQIDSDGNQSRVREVYEVAPVVDAGGKSLLMIVGVQTQPESFVDLASAQEMLSGFLTALKASEYDEACCLSDAGYLDELEALLTDDEYDQGKLLDQYCQSALCHVPFEIVTPAALEPFARSFMVRFAAPEGEVVKEMMVGMWEGQLFVGSLPPSTDR